MPDSAFNPSSALEAAKLAFDAAKSVVDALAISEIRYRRLFQAARDGVLLLDSDEGKVTDANPFMTELLGYSYEELIGKELWEIGLLSDKAASQEAFQRLKTTNYIRYEDLPLENQRGERLEVEFVSNLYHEGGHTVIQCNIRDITDRKRVEAELAATAIRYRRLFETTRDGVLILDTDEGKVADANPFITELLGYSHAELIGKELWEIGLLKDKVASQVAFQRLKRDFHIRYENLPLENRRGERLEVEFVSNLYREGGHTVIQCNIRDITERKRVEAELAATAIRYRRLFETTRDGVLILDTDEGKVADANPFITELLGYSHDELIGKELWEIGLLKDKSDSQEAFQRLKRDFHIRYENLPLENRRGERLEVEFISNLYHEGGHTVIQCNIRDITERKRVELILASAATKNELIAETLQRSMLQAAPSGRFEGIAIETLYEPALNEAEVGGDFFDAFLLDENRMALAVGDVSGKGLVAAARTSEVKYALRTLLHEHQAPDLALTRLNEFICKTHLFGKNDGEAFIVLAVAIVNIATGETLFSAAGAEPTLVLKTDGTVEYVSMIGTPLGIHMEATYGVEARMLAVGDTVIMATDGITEARRENDFLGICGMANLASTAGVSITLPELRQAIYRGAVAFADGGLRDDVCMLLARRQ
ncbi:MAG TPA: PAS domain S-box protein [Capsulimonadaceae bacterium]